MTFCESHFLAKSQTKNKNVIFYPSARSRRDLKIVSSGVIFRDASASDVQKFVALQNHLVFNLSYFRNYTHHFFAKVAFWPKVNQKTKNVIFYPSARSRRDLKIISSGVIFRDASASDVQKFVAPQKQAVVFLLCSLNYNLVYPSDQNKS